MNPSIHHTVILAVTTADLVEMGKKKGIDEVRHQQ